MVTEDTERKLLEDMVEHLTSSIPPLEDISEWDIPEWGERGVFLERALNLGIGDPESIVLLYETIIDFYSVGSDEKALREGAKELKLEVMKEMIDEIEKNKEGLELYKKRLDDFSKRIEIVKADETEVSDYFPYKKDALDYIGIKPETYREWVKEGRVPTMNEEPGKGYPRADIDFIKSCIITHPHGEPVGFNEPAYLEDEILKRGLYGIKSHEVILQLEKAGLLVPSRRIKRHHLREKDKKPKQYYELIYTESVLLGFYEKLKEDTSIAEQFGLNLKVVELAHPQYDLAEVSSDLVVNKLPSTKQVVLREPNKII